MNYYLIASSCLFLVLGIIWSANGWVNKLTRIILIGFGVWGLYHTLIALGYIVRPISGCCG